MGPPGDASNEVRDLLAFRLRAARRAAKLGPQELATAVAVSPKSIQRYESGERVPMSRGVVEAWERECGVATGELTALFDQLQGNGTVPRPPEPGPPSTAASAQRPGWAVAAVGLVAVVALAVALVVAVGGGDDPAPAVDTGWDHKDPQESGCSTTAVLLASVPVMQGGRRMGRLELRGSTSCQAAWGRVVLDETHAPPFFVEVLRPSDGERDVYRYPKPHRIVFGNMLKHEDGCVRAAVRVGTLRAQTPCRR